MTTQPPGWLKRAVELANGDGVDQKLVDALAARYVDALYSHDSPVQEGLARGAVIERLGAVAAACSDGAPDETRLALAAMGLYNLNLALANLGLRVTEVVVGPADGGAA